jgi:hypothetical protein
MGADLGLTVRRRIREDERVHFLGKGSHCDWEIQNQMFATNAGERDRSREGVENEPWRGDGFVAVLGRFLRQER